VLSKSFCGCLLAFAALTLPAAAQTIAPNEWAWMSGGTDPRLNGPPGVYGTLHVPAPGNVPGARESAATWTDSKGNLWLFGGFGYDSAGAQGELNDLWEFNASNNEWAWMGGSNTLGTSTIEPGVYGTLGTPSAANIPSGRSATATWTDASGHFWLFGGADFNDLWEFYPTTNEWAWMGGSNGSNCNYCNEEGVYGTLGTPAPGNIPGARWMAASWTDNKGNFWLFSGIGQDSVNLNGNLNDLWEYNPSTNEWAWMGGSKTLFMADLGMPGVYGTFQTPSAGNLPGSRTEAVSWTDSKGNLWLFGGLGYDSEYARGQLNDLWEFSPSTNEWAWMGGSSTTGIGLDQTGQPGVYQTWMTPSAGNTPGGRIGAVGWTDGGGNLWLFGGYGPTFQDALVELNDLWEFNPSTLEWAWMGGSNPIDYCNASSCSEGPPGVYGTLQTPAFENTPGGRRTATTWTDPRGNFWLFGGYGVGSVGSGDLNDLWEFQSNVGGLASAATPTFSPNTGIFTTAQSVEISDTTPGAAIYYYIDGSNAPTQYTEPITVSSPETIQAIAVASGYANSAAVTATYTVNLPIVATPTFSVPAGTYATAQTVAISDTTPGATIYYTTDSTTPTTSSSVYSGAITISSYETIQAVAVAAGYANSAIAAAAYTIWPSSGQGEWAWMQGRRILIAI